ISAGNVSFFLAAKALSSLLAFVWSSTIIWPNFFISGLWALETASLPNSTSAMPPCAASFAKSVGLLVVALFIVFATLLATFPAVFATVFAALAAVLVIRLVLMLVVLSPHAENMIMLVTANIANKIIRFMTSPVFIKFTLREILLNRGRSL